MMKKRTLKDLAIDAREKGIPETSPERLERDRAASEKPIIVDVREPDEQVEGMIPEAHPIPRGVLERDIEKRVFGGQAEEEDLDRPIVCYCGGGSRSLLAAEQLRAMGFARVASLEGGFAAWKKAGLPVKTP